MQVQEIKDVVGLGIGVAQLVDSAAAGLSFSQVFGVIGVLKQVKPAIEAVKSGKLLAEFQDLDDAEKADLVSWFDSSFQIKEQDVEQLIEKIWLAVLSLSDLAKILPVKP